MGGDFAPEAVVKGVVESLSLLDATTKVVLFGDKEAVERCLQAVLTDVQLRAGIFFQNPGTFRGFLQSIQVEGSVVHG